MPVESYFKFKDYNLWLRNGFLIPFELLLFEEIQTIYGESDKELNEFKKIIANDALYMVVIGDLGCIDFDEILSADLLKKILLLTDNIIKITSIDKSYLTVVRINELVNIAKDYLVDRGEIFKDSVLLEAICVILKMADTKRN